MDKKSEQHWLPEVCSRLSGQNQEWGSGGGGLEERQVVRSYFGFPSCLTVPQSVQIPMYVRLSGTRELLSWSLSLFPYPC